MPERDDGTLEIDKVFFAWCRLRWSHALYFLSYMIGFWPTGLDSLPSVSLFRLTRLGTTPRVGESRRKADSLFHDIPVPGCRICRV